MTKYLTMALVAIGVIVLVASLFDKIAEQKEQLRISERNMVAMTSDVKYYKNKDGQSVATIDGLQMNISTAQKTNIELMQKVASLNLKLKSISSVVEVDSELKYINQEPIAPTTNEDTLKVYKLDDQWLKAEFIIYRDTIMPNGLTLSIPNSQTVAVELRYRRVWLFWKRPNGAKIHIVNSNPYIDTVSATYIDFGKGK